MRLLGYLEVDEKARDIMLHFYTVALSSSINRSFKKKKSGRVTNLLKTIIIHWSILSLKNKEERRSLWKLIPSASALQGQICSAIVQASSLKPPPTQKPMMRLISNLRLTDKPDYDEHDTRGWDLGQKSHFGHAFVNATICPTSFR